MAFDWNAFAQPTIAGIQGGAQAFSHHLMDAERRQKDLDEFMKKFDVQRTAQLADRDDEKKFTRELRELDVDNQFWTAFYDKNPFVRDLHQRSQGQDQFGAALPEDVANWNMYEDLTRTIASGQPLDEEQRELLNSLPAPVQATILEKDFTLREHVRKRSLEDEEGTRRRELHPLHKEDIESGISYRKSMEGDREVGRLHQKWDRRDAAKGARSKYVAGLHKELEDIYLKIEEKKAQMWRTVRTSGLTEKQWNKSPEDEAYQTQIALLDRRARALKSALENGGDNELVEAAKRFPDADLEDLFELYELFKAGIYDDDM